MGVKMFEARYGAGIITLKQYEDEMNGKIYCKYCGTPITYVNGYVREVGERDVNVPAYFRLRNGKVSPHDEHCKYATENVIKDIYAECCNEEDLMSKEGEAYIVRLHILIDSLDATVKEKGSANTEKKIKRSTLQYIKSGDKPAYITTIKKILKLRCQIDKDSIGELKNKLKLRFYNRNSRQYDEVSWNHFFFEYDKENYYRAFKYILKKIYHPVTFCGEVKSVKLPTDNFKYYKIRIYSVRVGQGKYVSLSILFTSPKIYEEVKSYEDCNIVIYGSGAYANSKVVKVEGSEVEYFNISIRIYGANQIMKVESF